MTALSSRVPMEETIRWAVDALDSPMDRSLIADRLKEALQAAPSRERAREALEKIAALAAIAALRSVPDGASDEKPIAMLGGIHGVCLIRHIENMQPDARKEYHTPLYRHPPSDKRVKMLEDALKAVRFNLIRAGYSPNSIMIEGIDKALSPTDAPAAEG